ncbi:MAG TPA: hypothetical protein VEC75_13490, partial [Stellaceae bacterium]|nr:hypothetical protein [Stellaceae bacterium]
MRASRDERGPGNRRRSIAALLATLLFAAPAAAQVGPPVPLIPPPPGAAPASSPAPQPKAPSTGDSGIETAPLAPVDATWTGTLSPADGAFPETMWQGTSRSLVAGRLVQLQPNTSPVLQDLARRLLLTTARPPGGEDPPDGPSLAMLRLERLMVLGQVDGALAIADLVRTKGDPQRLDRLRVEAHFAANDVEGGCGAVKAAIGRYQDFWWDRALIACQALSGDQAKASVGLNLLQERKAPRDGVFDALVAAVGNRKLKVEHMPEPTPIRVALLAAAKLPLPPDALQAASPAVLHQWATNPSVPAEGRLSAGERAAALGAISLDELRKLYASIPPSTTERKAALVRAAGENPRARAVIYSVAKDEPAPGVRAELLAALLDAGRKHGFFLLMARLTAPILREMKPSPDLDWFAPAAVRALYGAGDAEVAERWLPLADAEVESQMAGIGKETPAPARAGARLFGETVLGVLVSAQRDGGLSSDLAVIQSSAMALRGIGLEREARQLEVEA